MSKPPKPEMTRLRRNWLVQLAGIRAAEKAREAGEDPEATAALMDAAVFDEGFPIGPHKLVYNCATLQLMEKLGERLAYFGKEITIGHVIFVLAEQNEAWIRLRTPEAFDLNEWETVIFCFTQTVTADELRKANAWFMQEKARVEGQKGGVPEKLPQQQAGESEPSPTTPAETDPAG